MFSSRVPGHLEPNRLSTAVTALRAAGTAIIDLTESNPTRVGLPYPADLLAPLADPAGRAYEPEPFGNGRARRAVAGEYARRGVPVDPGRIVLTASTSEAYSLLFRLLCDPGDEVLVPRPGYPLFEHLTRLDEVRAVPYDLEAHGHWAIDLAGVARRLGDRTRAIVLISPHNPTGSVLTADEIEAVVELCRGRGVALIGDEVFADYRFDEAGGRAASVLEQDRVLAFALGGLSKSAGLPQVKLGWMAAGGPAALVSSALGRLEVACDAYLSVSTPVQLAAEALMCRGAQVRAAIAARTRQNLAAIQRIAAGWPAARVATPAGGWSVPVRIPATRPEEELILELLEHDRVLVHPGYFFDFAEEAWAVVSLLPEPAAFELGVGRLFARLGGGLEHRP